MRAIENFKMSKWKKSSSVENDGKDKSKTSKDKWINTKIFSSERSWKLQWCLPCLGPGQQWRDGGRRWLFIVILPQCRVKKFKVWVLHLQENGKIACLWGYVSIQYQYSFSFILIEAEQYRGVSILSPHYFSAELAVVLQVLGLPGGVQEV